MIDKNLYNSSANKNVIDKFLRCCIPEGHDTVTSNYKEDCIWMFLTLSQEYYVSPFRMLSRMYCDNLLEERALITVRKKIYDKIPIGNQETRNSKDVLKVVVEDFGVLLSKKNGSCHYLYEDYQINKNSSERDIKKLSLFIFQILNMCFKDGNYILEFSFKDDINYVLACKDIIQKICIDLCLEHGDVTYVIPQSEMFDFTLDKSTIKSSRIIQYFHYYQNYCLCTIIKFCDFNIHDLVLHMDEDDAEEKKKKKVFFDHVIRSPFFYSDIKKIILSNLDVFIKKENERYKSFLKDLLCMPDSYLSKFNLLEKIFTKISENEFSMLYQYLFYKITDTQSEYICKLVQSICVCDVSSTESSVNRYCVENCKSMNLTVTNLNFIEVFRKVFNPTFKSKYLKRNTAEYYFLMCQTILFLVENLNKENLSTIKMLVNHSEREIILFLINEFTNVKYNLYCIVSIINIFKEDPFLTNNNSKYIYGNISNNVMEVKRSIDSIGVLAALIKHF